MALGLWRRAILLALRLAAALLLLLEQAQDLLSNRASPGRIGLDQLLRCCCRIRQLPPALLLLLLKVSHGSSHACGKV